MSKVVVTMTVDSPTSLWFLLMNVLKPLNIALGGLGNALSLFNSDQTVFPDLFLVNLWKKRYFGEGFEFPFSRRERRLARVMKIVRKGVADAMTQATQASQCCQNAIHTVSDAGPFFIPPIRTAVMITMTNDRQRNIPRDSFCLIFIRLVRRIQIGMLATIDFVGRGTWYEEGVWLTHHVATDIHNSRDGDENSRVLDSKSHGPRILCFWAFG